ncbi:cytochrome P450 [Artomyces pyxidatus]|uniref:Cytochrome P450 n=1 Tax=Artomyces pyxidatus TaxID=48021 RepID=A0ACB8SKV4_9AGAM|nr:cytochrome P450 [Artomyces pyxidatus]
MPARLELGQRRSPYSGLRDPTERPENLLCHQISSGGCHSTTMASYPFIALELVALAATLLLARAFERRRKRKGLVCPPGPTPLPVVGDLFDIPSEYSWLSYAKWGKTYGDVISLTVFGKVIIVLNSYKSARDLLDKRSAIYSERPPLPFYDLMGWGWFFPTAPYNDLWRASRKVVDRGLRPNVAVQYQPNAEGEGPPFPQ